MEGVVNPEYPILGFLRLKAGVIGRPIRETHGTIVDRIAAASGVIRVANGFRCPDDRENGGTFTDAAGSTCGLRIARGAMESPADIVARGLRQRRAASATRRQVAVPDNPAYHGVGRDLPNGFGNPAYGEVTRHFSNHGQTLRGTPISWQDDRIPDTVFHVTTASRAVGREGLLRASGQGGLGGDRADRIVSMTINRADAEQIKEDMLLAFDIARAVDVDEAIDLILEDAKKYGLLGDPRMSSLLERLAASAENYDTPDGKLASVMNGYLWARDTWGGPKNPVFVNLTDTLENLRMREREDIDIVDIPKDSLNTGAMLVDFDMSRSDGGLGEIRLYGDITLDGSEDLQATIDDLIEEKNETIKSIYNQDGNFFEEIAESYVKKVKKWQETGQITSEFAFDTETSEERSEKVKTAINDAVLLFRSDPSILGQMGLSVSPEIIDFFSNSSIDEITDTLTYATFGMYQEFQSGESRVRMKRTALQQFLESGIYKTTHTEGFLPSTPISLRREYETFIGIPPDLPSELRPVSGYAIKPKALERASGGNAVGSGKTILRDEELGTPLKLYGSIDLVLHDSVRGRSVLASGDGMDNRSHFVPFDLESPTTGIFNAMLAPMTTHREPSVSNNLHFIAQILDGERKGDYSDVGRRNAGGMSWVDTYTEVMVAGGLGIEDIREIVVPYEAIREMAYPSFEENADKVEDLIENYFSLAELRAAGLTQSEAEIALSIIPNLIRSPKGQVADYLAAIKAGKLQDQVERLSSTTKLSFSTPDGSDPLDPAQYGLPIAAPLLPSLKSAAFDTISKLVNEYVSSGTARQSENRIVG